MPPWQIQGQTASFVIEQGIYEVGDFDLVGETDALALKAHQMLSMQWARPMLSIKKAQGMHDLPLS